MKCHIQFRSNSWLQIRFEKLRYTDTVWPQYVKLMLSLCTLRDHAREERWFHVFRAEKETLIPTGLVTGWALEKAWTFLSTEKASSLPGIETQLIVRPACCLFPTLATWSRLPIGERHIWQNIMTVSKARWIYIRRAEWGVNISNLEPQKLPSFASRQRKTKRPVSNWPVWRPGDIRNCKHKHLQPHHDVWQFCVTGNFLLTDTTLHHWVVGSRISEGVTFLHKSRNRYSLAYRRIPESEVSLVCPTSGRPCCVMQPTPKLIIYI